MALPKLDPAEVRDYYALATAGVEMVAPLILGLIVDRWLGCWPWLTILGAIVGPVGGILHMLRIVRRMEARNREKNQKVE